MKEDLNLKVTVSCLFIISLVLNPDKTLKKSKMNSSAVNPHTMTESKNTDKSSDSPSSVSKNDQTNTILLTNKANFVNLLNEQPDDKNKKVPDLSKNAETSNENKDSSNLANAQINIIDLKIPKSNEKDKQKQTLKPIDSFKEQISIDYLNKQSNVSQVIADSIAKKVMLIILLMLILSPLSSTYLFQSSMNNSYTIICQFNDDYFASKLPKVNNNINKTEAYLSIFNDNNYNQTFTHFLHEKQDINFPILTLQYTNTYLYISKDYYSESYRRGEILITYQQFNQTILTYSNKNLMIGSAIISMVRTSFIFVIIFYLLSQLENDARIVILEPLQVMVEVVETVSKDPVNAKNYEDLGKTISNSLKKLKKNKQRQGAYISKYEFESQHEVQIIQLAIIKICQLLAISFGEAGGEIIKENISSSSELNPLIKGKMKNAIFGFCDIRKFSDINEALQEKTMLFVNEVADEIHSAVDRFGGSTNKNLGDVFLMVWKETEKRKNKEFPHFNNNNFTADQALLAYLYCIHKINKSHALYLYKKDDDMIKKFGKSFKVTMGFGLHLGWGIEGAIGSFYKIDASYLSPNVNIAARLMTATKQYKVSILISGNVASNLSEELRALCRKIDVVTVKGSNKPLDLYTVDVNMKPKIGKEKERMNIKARKKYLRGKKTEVQSLYFQSNGSFKLFLSSKKNFKELLKTKRGQIFYKTFEEGLDFYIKGDWKLAYEKLNDCKFIDESDGPTQSLLEFIKKRNMQCPEDWKGYRALMSK